MERNENKYPLLKGELPDISGYDRIILGTGIWGYTMANPVISFIHVMNFDGKKMSAFWTFYDHDEKVNQDMKDSLKGVEYADGLPLPRSLTGNRIKTDKAVDQWIKTL